MARRLRRRNPRLLGSKENVGELVLVGLGVGATQFINQNIVGKVAGGIIPSGGAVGKVVDAATTLVSSMVLGIGAGLINKSWARDLRLGGDALAVAKGVGAVLPFYTLDGSIKTPAGWTAALNPPKPAQQLPSGTNGTATGNGTPTGNGTATLQSIGVKSMGL
ncbi:MAG: hypothetical protein EPO21_13190 [Chloroflexota bacterium]|nr:MAG: hypothetical protein EPO21_13190 [Chloroflexota bacterium]